MMTWVICGAGLEPIMVKADSFDEAIRKARLRDKRYCGGYVEDED